MVGWMLYTKYIILVGKESLCTIFDLGHFGRLRGSVAFEIEIRF